MLKQGSAGEGGAEGAGLAPVQGAGEQGQGSIQVSQAFTSPAMIYSVLKVFSW